MLIERNLLELLNHWWKEGEDTGKNDLNTLIFSMEKFKVPESFLIYNGSTGEIKLNNLIIKKFSLNDLLINKNEILVN